MNLKRLLLLFGAGGGVSPLSFFAAEAGDVGTTTIEVQFTKSVAAAGNDYASGVTVKVGGAGVAVVSATRQVDTRYVHYVIAAPADVNDAITWEYSAAAGHITDAAGVAMLDVAARPVTNYIGSQFYFNDFNASGHLATLGV